MSYELQDVRGDELHPGDEIHFPYDIKCTVVTLSATNSVRISIVLKCGTKQETRSIGRSQKFKVKRHT